MESWIKIKAGQQEMEDFYFNVYYYKAIESMLYLEEMAKAAYRRIAQGTDLISDLSTEINLYAMTLQAAMAITEI